jgi:hypothetical protein
VQQAPKPDLKSQPKSETSGRQPSVDRSNPQPEPSKPEKKSTAGRSEAAPRETKAQQESQQPAKEKPVAGEKGATTLLKKDTEK